MRMRRAIGVVALMVLPVSVATVGFASMAAAASGVSCSKLVVSLTTGNGKLSGCTDPANTGKTGTFPIATLVSGVGSTGTITWNKTGTTNITVTTFGTVTPNACPTGYTEYEAMATITGGTGEAAKSIKKKWTFQAFVCVDASSAPISIELLPGSKVEIGPKY